MSAIDKRLARLEVAQPNSGLTTFVWRNAGQSDVDALLVRFGDVPRPPRVTFIQWRVDGDPLSCRPAFSTEVKGVS